MKIAKFVAWMGVLAMGGILIYAFAVGEFQAQGRLLTSMPWGIVSLVDLYVGFALFAMWIAYREPTWWRSAIWIVLLMVLGFFIGSLYTLLALYQSDDDWQVFWNGRFQ